MKKMYLSAAVLTAIMVSCSSNEEEYKTDGLEPDAVSFSTYVNMPKRAVDNAVFVPGDQICVNAFLSSGSMVGQEFTNNFMQNEVLTCNLPAGWNYTNMKYWPMNTTDRISFVASYPNISPTIENGICSFDFAVNADPAQQRNFLWSTITDAQRTDRNGTHQNGEEENPATTPQANVTLRFRRALSKVSFRFKAADSYNATITITEVVVNNLYGEGTYELTPELGEGSWTMSGQQDNSYTVLTGSTPPLENEYYNVITTTLLMIPQTLSTTDGTASTVTIRYAVNYQNPAHTVYEERTFNLATTDITAWEQNRVYNYRATIALDNIAFDAEITTWGGRARPR